MLALGRVAERAMLPLLGIKWYTAISHVSLGTVADGAMVPLI